MKGVVHVADAAFSLDDQAGTVTADIALAIPTIIGARLRMPQLDLDAYRLTAEALSGLVPPATAPSGTGTASGEIEPPLFDITAALDLIHATDYDLVILDLGLPDMDGLNICRTVRSTSNVPIIMLTARDDDIDKIVGLEVGADDYLTKPFTPDEMMATVRGRLDKQRSWRQATQALAELADLESLVESLGDGFERADLDSVDEEAVERILGRGARDDLEALRRLQSELERAGFHD